MKRLTYVWIALFVVGCLVGLLIKQSSVAGIMVSTSTARLDMIVTLPTIVMLVALIPLGYYAGRRFPHGL